MNASNGATGSALAVRGGVRLRSFEVNNGHPQACNDEDYGVVVDGSGVAVDVTSSHMSCGGLLASTSANIVSLPSFVGSAGLTVRLAVALWRVYCCESAWSILIQRQPTGGQCASAERHQLCAGGGQAEHNEPALVQRPAQRHSAGERLRRYHAHRRLQPAQPEPGSH
jgi:hypothetical protein